MQIRREGDTAVTDDKPQDNVPPPPGGAPAPEKDLPGEDTRSHLAELSAKLIAMNAAAAGQAARATSAHWARTARALAGLWGGAANAALDMARADPLLLAAAWRDYATDARQRAALTLPRDAGRLRVPWRETGRGQYSKQESELLGADRWRWSRHHATRTP